MKISLRAFRRACSNLERTVALDPRSVVGRLAIGLYQIAHPAHALAGDAARQPEGLAAQNHGDLFVQRHLGLGRDLAVQRRNRVPRLVQAEDAPRRLEGR